MTNPIDSTNEVWKPVPGWEGFYSVSNLGRVRRDGKAMGAKIGRFLALRIHKKDGYLGVILSKGPSFPVEAVTVHRLVMRAFVGPCPNGYEVNHRDYNRKNNCSNNLEYVTRQQNVNHSKERHFKKAPRGESHYKSTLTNSDVLKIRELMNADVKNRTIERQFGISAATASLIRHRKSWKHI